MRQAMLLIALMAITGVGGLLAQRPGQETTRRPGDGESEIDQENERPDDLSALYDGDYADTSRQGYLASLASQDLSREQLRAILQRTIDMIDHQTLAERPRRVEQYHNEAKKLGRSLTRIC